MSKFGKFKEILSIAAPMAKPFVPGAAGTMLDEVNKVLNKTGAGADAVKTLAEHVDAYNDEQDKAILALHERVKALEAKG